MRGPEPTTANADSFYSSASDLTLTASSAFCGNSSLSFFDPSDGAIGECFAKVFVLTPAHAALALCSAYGVGKAFAGSRVVVADGRPRGALQLAAVALRALAVFVLLLTPVACTAALYSTDSERVEERSGISQIYVASLQSASWAVHAALVLAVAMGRMDSAAVQYANRIWLFCAVADGVQCHSLLTRYKPGRDPFNDIFFSMGFIQAAMLATYLAALLMYLLGSSGDDYERLAPDYRARRAVEDPHYLGVAKEESPFLSKFVFYWVNPLIKKGRMGLLQTPDDVFDVPPSMGTSAVSEKFHAARDSLSESSRRGKVVVMRVLFECFGAQFFAIGSLKFIADCAGFASPLLLNGLLSFMQNRDEDMKWGYLFAFGMAGTTLITALCNAHFNLFMSELGLKIRAAVTASVYRHTVRLSAAQMGQFGVGEVINFMSTDTDRIVNFSPTLHATWSLPLQVAVTMFLLYRQVGLSCLVGVAIAVVMIPLNKYVADKIGAMSTKMMSAKDERVKLMSEVLHGVRSLKFFAWEEYFLGRVGRCRNEELKYLKGRKYLDAVCVYLWATTPVLISVLTFVSFALSGNELTAPKVFTSVALFAMLTGPLNAFPWVLNGLVEAMVSIRRVSTFLAVMPVERSAYFSPMEEVADMEKAECTDIAIGRGKFSVGSVDARSEEETDANCFSLCDIDLSVEKGDFIGIIGKVGSGKSSLLSAVLGELRRDGGGIAVSDHPGGIGYVPQEPWLQQGSIRDNILFGKEYEAHLYEKVVRACCLDGDFARMASGDATDVGERGAMLSGGQRARVGLARAVYQNKELYLIDDVFSAVDVPVGKQIYQKCIYGLLRGKTRLLCTHHPKFISGANSFLLMEGGQVVEQGPAHEFPTFEPDVRSRRGSGEDVEDEGAEEAFAVSDVVEEESRERGSVKSAVYKQYVRAVGTSLSATIALSLALMQVSKNMTDVWLAEWVSAEKADNRTTDGGGDVVVDFYLPVYGGIAGANSLFSLARAFLFAYGGICAARNVHEKLIGVVMAARTSFFDATPVGRILNRFSSDLYTVDDSLPFILNIFLARLFAVFGVLVICVYSVPWIVLLLVPLGFVYYDVQKNYRPASRDLKRVASVSLSPIYAHFSETLDGLAVIRAMKEAPRFVSQNEERVDRSVRSQFAGVAAAQWLELRLQMIGVAVIGGIALIAVLQHHSLNGSVNAGYLGLALSYALGVSSSLSDLVRIFTETEKELVAVERCCEYIDRVPTEDYSGGEAAGPQPGPDWPGEGVVTFKDVCMRYKESLPLVLHNFSLATRPAEKVGVVGRTGAGKSSLFQVLFRFVEVEHGGVEIDGVSAAGVPLRRLRGAIAIIPQDPFLFSGSVRENVDPAGQKSDAELWDAIRKARMESAIRGMNGGLDASVGEKGSNFSMGQRQLLCLARTILSPAKIVCIDEATANVDLETDRLVQGVLKTALADRTVITVAHRVETIMGADRVVVVAAGRAVEVGNPIELLKDEDSAFSRHVNRN